MAKKSLGRMAGKLGMGSLRGEGGRLGTATLGEAGMKEAEKIRVIQEGAVGASEKKTLEGGVGGAEQKSGVATVLKNVGVCLLMAGWGFAAILISEVATYWAFSIFMDFQAAEPWQTTLYSAVMYVLAFGLAALAPGLLVRKWRTSREEVGLRGAPTWMDIGLAIAAFIIYLLVANLAVAAFQAVFPWFDANQAQDVGYSNLMATPDLIVAFLALVVVAPVAEELIFRGWLYGKMRGLVCTPVAILLVSLLFGLLHGQWNVAIDVFVMSVVMCLQRELTGTVYSGILLHMIKNGLAFYLLFIQM